MEIILIRHGIAEAEDGSKPDAERRLTGKGRRRFEESVPALCRLLRGKQVRIWSSPLLRARETADILAPALGATVEEFGEIAGGSFDALLEPLIQADPDSRIVIVGHQPELGSWSSRICSMDLPFRKGAAALFRLAQPVTGQGELRWFLQPGPLRRLSR